MGFEELFADPAIKHCVRYSYAIVVSGIFIEDPILILKKPRINLCFIMIFSFGIVYGSL